MSQTRIQDYGSAANALSIKTMIKSILPVSGTLYGNEFTVVRGSAIQIAPGACLTKEGVIILENEYKEISIPDLSIQGNYTIYYSHEDDMISGGVPAILTIDSGFLIDVLGVVLGYVAYDGNQLVQDQIIQPPPLKIGYVQNKIDSNWIFPSKNTVVITKNEGGAIINVTDVQETFNNKNEMFIKVKNNSDPYDVNRIGYVTLSFPFKVLEEPFALLQMIAAAGEGAFITLRFEDSIGGITTFEVPPAQIFTSSLYLREFNKNTDSKYFSEVTTQTPNTVCYVHVDLQLGVGSEIKLQAIGLSPYNVPV